jgi:hypothetical protein
MRIHTQPFSVEGKPYYDAGVRSFMHDKSIPLTSTPSGIYADEEHQLELYQMAQPISLGEPCDDCSAALSRGVVREFWTEERQKAAAATLRAE